MLWKGYFWCVFPISRLVSHRSAALENDVRQFAQLVRCNWHIERKVSTWYYSVAPQNAHLIFGSPESI